MDSIDRALGELRVTGSMVGRVLVDPPWGLMLDSADPCLLAAVVRGSAWAGLGEGDPVLLETGDAVLACGGGPLCLGDTPETPPDTVVTGHDTCFDPRTGADLSESCVLGGRTFGKPDGAVQVIVGGCHAEGATFDLLAADLPSLFAVRASPDITPLLEVIAHETVGGRAGQQTTFDRLVELIAITATRSWLAESGGTNVSWAAALYDPIVGPALEAMHDAPERRWTVAALAAESATSRASFARHFRARVGVGPLTHLARWRMAVATDQMRAAPQLGLGEIAAAVGYADAFSFSNAYRRICGVSPSAARRAAADNELARVVPARSTAGAPEGRRAA